MNAVSKTLSGLMLTAVLGVNAVHAAIVTYTDRTAFESVASILPVEDFEEGVVAAGAAVNFVDPLNSTTDNGVFSPGDILPGLTLQTPFPNDPGFDLVLLGASPSGNQSKAVYATAPSDSLDLLFGHANAVGFDLLISSTPATVDISVFGSNDVLMGSFSVSAVVAGSFLGMISDMGPITRINVSSQSHPANPAGGYFEGVDNVAFGVVPEPPVVFLIGAGLVGLGSMARRRAMSA